MTTVSQPLQSRFPLDASLAASSIPSFSASLVATTLSASRLLQKPKSGQTESPSGASSAHGTACTPPVENSNPSGASEGADGQGVCTIDTSKLSETWLPAYVQELRELDLANKLHVSVHRRKVKDTLSYSGLCCLAQQKLRETVEHIRTRGGLLLIGGVR